MATISQAQSAKEKLKEQLGADSGIAIGIAGESPSALHLAVRVKTEAGKKKVPESVDGVSVVTEVVGQIRALEEPTVSPNRGTL